MQKKLIGSIIFVILAVAAVAYFFVIPEMFYRKANAVLNPSPYSYSAEADRIHKTLMLADWHADILLWNRDLLKPVKKGHIDLLRLQKARMGIQVFSTVSKVPRNLNYFSNPADSDSLVALMSAQRWPVRTWFSPFERTVYEGDKLLQFIADSHGQIQLITNQKSLNEFLDKKKSDPKLLGALLGSEGLHSIEGSLEKLKVLEKQGFRVLGLTHFFDNEIGGSAHGEKKGGLTDFGKQVIEYANQHDLIIDLAHSSKDLYFDVLKYSQKAAIVSHTGVNGTCPSPRNLTDEQIRAIAEKDGLIGIGFWGDVLCGSEPKYVALAMNYVKKLVGVKVLALGTDYEGAVTVGFDVTGIPMVIEELLKLGWTEQEITQVMQDNSLHFLQSHLPPL